MSVFLDRSTGWWTLKTKTTEGKDKRVKLRKLSPNEPSKPIPADVASLAIERRLSFGSQTEKRSVEYDVFTLRGVVETFYNDYKLHRRAGSALRLRGILDHFLRFAMIHNVSKIEYVRVDTIHVFFTWRLEQTYKRLKKKIRPQTALSEVELLSGLFRFAIKKGWYQGTNPCSEPVKELRSHYPKIETTKYLDPDTIRAFLDALQRGVTKRLIPPDYADLALVMLNSGLRVEAACHLDHDWVDYKNWSVTVPPEHDKLKRGYTAYVADGGRPVLQSRKAASDRRGRVFPNGVTADMSYYYLRKVCRKYGVNATGSFNHMLRHTIATNMVDHDVSILVIMEQLGQRNVKTTMRYARVRDEAKKKAIERVKW